MPRPPRSPSSRSGARPPARRDALTYEARAATLLGRALELTPADRRTTFWREVVTPDDALSALRKWTRFATLARMAAAPSH